jgi:hypothetical protein
VASFLLRCFVVHIQRKPRSSFALASVLVGSWALLGSLIGCGGVATKAGATDGEGGRSGGSNGSAGQGVANSGGTGGAGTGGLGAGGLFDSSPGADPCAQSVYDLDTYCAMPENAFVAYILGQTAVCTLGSVPDCATLKDRSPSGEAYLQSGCGYLFIDVAAGEGDVIHGVYDLSTQRLVFLSTVASATTGCEIGNKQVGMLPPPCSTRKDECANSADAGAGGSP